MSKLPCLNYEHSDVCRVKIIKSDAIWTFDSLNIFKTAFS